MSKLFIGSILIAGLISVSAGSAFAQSPGFCNDYANQAVISATQNRDMGCGFSGRRWTLNYQEHFGWCMSANPNDVISERLTRKHMIQACRG
jgi:hypothetical protein